MQHRRTCSYFLGTNQRTGSARRNHGQILCDMFCRPLQFEAVKVATHSSSKIVFCKFWGICLKPFLTFYIPLRTTYLFGGPKLSSTLQLFSEDWGLHFPFPPQRGFGFLTGGVASSGRKNVLRKLLRIPYRRLKASFSVCHCLFVWRSERVLTRLNEIDEPQLVIKSYGYITGKKFLR